MADKLDLVDVSGWQGGKRPFLIAGPCGVESPEQIDSVAAQLSTCGTNVLRGGIWKPRTRPGSFQGIGHEGLQWLKDAGSRYGLRVITEVAEPQHIEQALKVGIDLLWIGARTVVNPFQVQRIADALEGVEVPVLVKNPLTPDLDLWIGALERINRAGIRQLAAIHRGFSTYERSRYRNAPNWPIPIELKRRIPDLSLICDPSHIAGRRELVGAVAQTALDLDYDGLMVEVHPSPEIALSDKDQQLTPGEFAGLIQSLKLRNTTLVDVVSKSVLSDLRSSIDDLDRELLDKIIRRMELSRNIGLLKQENDVIIYQLDRWNEILRTRSEYATAEGSPLSRDFIIKLFELIHEESIHQQTQVMNAKTLPGEKV